VTKIMFTGVKT